MSNTTIMPVSYLNSDSRNERLRSALAFINHPDADWEEDKYYPNVIIRKGGIALLLTSSDSEKKGPASWSVNEDALLKLESLDRSQEIDVWYFLLERDNEELYQVLTQAPAIATNLLGKTSNLGRNGRGNYYWMDEFGEWVKPIRQRKKRRIPDFERLSAK